ncbi:GspH/FimT family pseudopilin [Parahaliea aestuarii]|uniref:Type II secretion system protein H n=1 Tax=Parahaliea aestuarii TaxID=1852021 RepID=A0A5C8ZQV8_9GAMM|nr:GspH/FimT family protein [Parahaliea aestuarii]TXS90012.1 prepilin-type N-terminal cleavage/methylation domain-containing protein [Parahaliea aestuarii]
MISFRFGGAGWSGPVSGGGQVKGFTLVELMIVLVILAVLLVLAAPAFQSAKSVSALKRYANELRSSAILARGEAIKRNAQVRLCATANGSSCAASGDWGQGWIVLDPNDRVVHQQQAIPADYRIIDPNSAVIDLVFQPSGIASTAAAIKVCQQAPAVSAEARIVRVTATGRSAVESVTASTCP